MKMYNFKNIQTIMMIIIIMKIINEWKKGKKKNLKENPGSN